MLYKWLALRFTDFDGNAIDAHLNNMPPFETVWDQFCVLRSRLRTASGEQPFAQRWKGASGSVIMRDVFTSERFFSGCKDYLYLFQHCATKTMCEAVVESMGGTWDKSSPADRHPHFESGVEEAVIAWSAPQPYHAEAKAFMTKVFNHLFGSPDKWNFTHADSRVNRVRQWAGGAGKVVAGKMSEKPRLPSEFYS